MILIISCSHHPESRSRLLAQAIDKAVVALGNTTHFLDLRTMPLPLCDGHSTHENREVLKARALVKSAKGILLSMPIYNYGVNAITKSFIENTGPSWNGKPVGMLCSAGGKGSYMALMPLVGSLMLDFHCYVLPRHVYAITNQFQEDRIIDTELQERITFLAADICWLSQALAEKQVNK
jgi:FMN reductase